MPEGTLVQVCAAGILSVLILRTVFDYLKSRKNGHDAEKIDQVLKTLDVRGPTNERLIYGPPGLGKNVEDLGRSLGENTQALHDQTRVMGRVLEELKANRTETSELNHALQNFLNLRH